MVSNVLEMGQHGLIALLRTFRRKYADDPEYARLRVELPKSWPF